MIHPDKPVAIVGIDPGPEPGVVVLWCSGGAVVRVDTYVDPWAALQAVQTAGCGAQGWPYPWVAVERFIVGRGTIRKTRAASMETIAQAERLKADAQRVTPHVQFLPAAAVKPVVTDAKLTAYGITGLPSRHHRDAARHAVFMGLKHGALNPALACST